MKPRLITIPISHFCEKARWGLERAGIAYEEEAHLQGIHRLATYRAAKTDETPVLVTDEGPIADSTAILKWADSKKPGAIYPKDAALRKQVEALENDFDEGFGVAGRLWMYTHMLGETKTVLRYSKMHGVPKYQIALFPIAFPFIRKMIEKAVSITPESRAQTESEVNQTFERVAKLLSDGRNFLTGDHFTAADLTFAALSAAVLIPENYGVKLPRIDELPEAMRSRVEQWRAHPAGKFAQRIYAEHRRTNQ